MRALVTGGAGFIGSNIARRLLERGDEVRILDNMSAGREDAVPEGAELLKLDLRDPDALAEVTDVDVIFHQAAVRSVPRSLDEPRITHDSNVNGTLNLLLAAEKHTVKRLVYASSSSVYGDVGDQKNVETLPPSPLSPYAASKLTGEYYCKVWALHGRVSTTSLRYFNVFGPGQHPESKYSAVFPAFISALQRGESPTIYGDGEQRRDFTFIDDVVDANLKAAESDRAHGEVINAASGNPRSVNELLRAVANGLGTWIEPTHAGPRPGDIRNSYADISKARDLLAWEPLVPWDEAVRSTVKWFAG
jgi:nucleoside-diphosphate-sugar epimerase